MEYQSTLKAVQLYKRQTFCALIGYVHLQILKRESCAGLLAPLLAHSAVIIPAGGRFSAKTFWKDACHYRATFYTAVPTMHQVLHTPGSCLCHTE